MRNGEPQGGGVTRRESGIIPTLMRILAGYSAARERKPKTILILTDGIWEGTNEKDVDTLITSHIKLLGLANPRDRYNAAHFRPVTFEFIRFGHDPAGMERLRRLDDDLKERGVPSVSPNIISHHRCNSDHASFSDLIDTEPADGDVYKMFLGSISEDMDELANVMNSAGLSAQSPLTPSLRSSLSFSPALEL